MATDTYRNKTQITIDGRNKTPRQRPSLTSARQTSRSHFTIVRGLVLKIPTPLSRGSRYSATVFGFVCVLESRCSDGLPAPRNASRRRSVFRKFPSFRTGSRGRVRLFSVFEALATTPTVDTVTTFGRPARARHRCRTGRTRSTVVRPSTEERRGTFRLSGANRGNARAFRHFLALRRLGLFINARHAASYAQVS